MIDLTLHLNNQLQFINILALCDISFAHIEYIDATHFLE
jgi:hypothetical protein